MATTSLNLLVLRVPDLERAADFYTSLGLELTKHAHGKGPEHYAAEMGSMVFELYPQTSPEATTTHVRIGFQVEDVELALAQLQAKGGQVISPPKASPWGRRAVVDDPFGHRIELTQPPAR